MHSSYLMMLPSSTSLPLALTTSSLLNILCSALMTVTLSLLSWTVVLYIVTIRSWSWSVWFWSKSGCSVHQEEISQIQSLICDILSLQTEYLIWFHHVQCHCLTSSSVQMWNVKRPGTSRILSSAFWYLPYPSSNRLCHHPYESSHHLYHHAFGQWDAGYHLKFWHARCMSSIIYLVQNLCVWSYNTSTQFSNPVDGFKCLVSHTYLNLLLIENQSATNSLKTYGAVV